MYKDPIARILQHMYSKSWRERRATPQNKGRVSQFQRKKKVLERGEKTIHQNSRKKMRRKERARKEKIQSFTREKSKQPTRKTLWISKKKRSKRESSLLK